ncbi:hypothetical protein AOXY_G2129 [Acipenser oxyrinchus oxyrinchus]|uniref:Uncharacterized protein n=2 Tax=Acipenser oxyrinchus oxyrinchus TaxID=40147 RepID=A0AAD8GI68_ACIOX|nr:hypothetical protein AOXY_G2129 [Acipenser oxyrinchus oxyrinchus]
MGEVVGLACWGVGEESGDCAAEFKRNANAVEVCSTVETVGDTNYEVVFLATDVESSEASGNYNKDEQTPAAQSLCSKSSIHLDRIPVAKDTKTGNLDMPWTILPRRHQLYAVESRKEKAGCSGEQSAILPKSLEVNRDEGQGDLQQRLMHYKELNETLRIELWNVGEEEGGKPGGLWRAEWWLFEKDSLVAEGTWETPGYLHNSTSRGSLSA